MLYLYIMSFRDWLELGWHSCLILFLVPGFLRLVLRSKLVWIVVAFAIVGGIVYHWIVVTDCHAWLLGKSEGYFCRWG